MPDMEALLRMLESPRSDRRYEACEELRVMASIPDPALSALQKATADADPDVADAARRALAVHTPPPAPTEPLHAADQPRPGAAGIPELVRAPMPAASPASPEYVLALERRVMALEYEQRRVAEQAAQANAAAGAVAQGLPKTAILSHSFLTRAFAVTGHVLVAQLAIALAVYLLLAMLGTVGGR